MCPKIPITSEDNEHIDNARENSPESVPEQPQAGGMDAEDADQEPAAADPGAAHQAARAYGAAAEAPADGVADELPDLEIKQGGKQEAQLPAGDKAEEYLDMLRRMKAEFENFKKRARREKADTIRYANEELLRKTLPIIDNLQRGITFAREQKLPEDIIKGFEMVEKQLLDMLSDYGAAPFESLNKPFDPNYHEPMTMMERDDVEDNTVIQELERGYMMHDRVLRVARVIVSRKPAGDQAEEDGGGAGGGE